MTSYLSLRPKPGVELRGFVSSGTAGVAFRDPGEDAETITIYLDHDDLRALVAVASDLLRTLDEGGALEVGTGRRGAPPTRPIDDPIVRFVGMVAVAVIVAILLSLYGGLLR